MQKAFTSQSSLERLKETKQSSLDNRVKSLHLKLIERLNDTQYDIGHTYKIARLFSDYEIVSVADYCIRKANHPGRAFVALFEKKITSKIG